MPQTRSAASPTDMPDDEGAVKMHVPGQAVSHFDDQWLGTEASDHVAALRGDDTLAGGAGDDTLIGHRGNDVMSGDEGDDLLRGGRGVDRLWGGQGDDVLRGGGGNDALFGGTGNDWLRGGRGDDSLAGEAGDDRLAGAQGNDILSGGAGADRLFGGLDNDTLIGGAGDDRIIGGRGEDTAVFEGSVLDHSWTAMNRFWLQVTDMAGDGGTDLLGRVETLQFDDYVLDLDGENAPLVQTAQSAPDSTALAEPKSDQSAGDGDFFEDDVSEISFSAYDFDGGAPELVEANVTGGGSLTLTGRTEHVDANAAGQDFFFDYDPGDSYQSLGVGESAEETVTVVIADGQGNSTTHTQTLVINGVNDAPEFAETEGTATVTEDVALEASGAVAANDVDANDSVTYSVAGGGEGIYGTLSVDADGVWTYTLDNEAEAVQTLMEGQSATDGFVITATDEHGAQDSYLLEVSVNGTADDTAEEVVVDFEDLDVEVGALMPLPEGYAGFEWNAASTILETDEFRGGEGTPYHEGATNGENVVLNAGSADIVMTRDEAFDLESATFISTSREGMELTVTGYLDGEETGSQTFILSTTEVTEADFDDEIFDEVDEVHYSTNYSSLGRFVMDDLTFFI